LLNLVSPLTVLSCFFLSVFPFRIAFLCFSYSLIFALYIFFILFLF
jgi:hypothetical protein